MLARGGVDSAERPSAIGKGVDKATQFVPERQSQFQVFDESFRLDLKQFHRPTKCRGAFRRS